MRKELPGNTHPALTSWRSRLNIVLLVRVLPIKHKEPQLTPLGAIERLGGVVNRLSSTLSENEGKISNLEESNRYIMRHLGMIDDRVDSLTSDQEEMGDTIKGLENEVHSLKIGTHEALDYGDERVGKAGSNMKATGQKRTRLT